MQINFDRAGCKPFFKKHSQQAKIESIIRQAITQQVTTGMSKVKIASHIKIHGHNSYEFRLNLGKIGSARVAFLLADHQATVLMISTDLQKSTFSDELNLLLKGQDKH